MLTASDIDRLKLSIDKWGMALVNELQLFREAFVANNMSICESCANNPCNKKAMLGDRRIYECTLYERAEQTEPNSSEKPNNCEWSVEYAKEMLDIMPCEECGHWEHGAHNHYYCALLEMRQECYFESKDESTLMFANKPKDEPQTDCSWK